MANQVIQYEHVNTSLAQTGFINQAPVNPECAPDVSFESAFTRPQPYADTSASSQFGFLNHDSNERGLAAHPDAVPGRHVTVYKDGGDLPGRNQVQQEVTTSDVVKGNFVANAPTSFEQVMKRQRAEAANALWNSRYSTYLGVANQETVNLVRMKDQPEPEAGKVQKFAISLPMGMPRAPIEAQREHGTWMYPGAQYPADGGIDQEGFTIAGVAPINQAQLTIVHKDGNANAVRSIPVTAFRESMDVNRSGRPQDAAVAASDWNGRVAPTAWSAGGAGYSTGGGQYTGYGVRNRVG